MAANVLTARLAANQVRLRDLADVQRRREWPTRIIQALGGIGLNQIGRALRSNRPPTVPRFTRLLFGVPVLSTLIARIVAFGIWRVRLRE